VEEADVASPVSDAGSIVAAWLVKLVLGLALIAYLGYNAIMLGVSRLEVSDDAPAAAQAASTAYREAVLSGDTGTVSPLAAATAAAASYARSHGDELVGGSVHIGSNDWVQVTLRRIAPTWLPSIGPLRSWPVATATGSGRSVA
jgi:hypothetical protein